MALSLEDVARFMEKGFSVTFYPDGSVANMTAPGEAQPAISFSQPDKQAEERRRKDRERKARKCPQGSAEFRGIPDASPSPSLSLSPLSPTPPIPALTHASPPTRTREGWKAEAQRIADEANATPLPDEWLGSEEVQHLWSEWSAHRTEMALKDKRKPWTPRAAKMEIEAISKALEIHDGNAILARIRTAIASGWQGLNLDSMRATPNFRLH